MLEVTPLVTVNRFYLQDLWFSLFFIIAFEAIILVSVAFKFGYGIRLCSVEYFTESTSKMGRLV